MASLVTTTVTGDITIYKAGSTKRVYVKNTDATYAGSFFADANAVKITAEGNYPLLLYTPGVLSLYSGSSVALTLNGSQAATFSGALSGTTATFSGNIYTPGLQSTNWIEVRADDAEFYFTNAANTRYWRQRLLAQGSDYSLITDYYNGSNNTNILSISSTGKVGIGTTAPGYQLEVNGNLDIIQAQGTGANAFFRATSDASTADWSFGADEMSVGANKFIIYDRVNSAYRMTIDNAGNVGINDTTPTYKLDVNGTFRVTGAATFDSSIGFTTVLAGNGSAGAPSFSFTSDTNTGIYRVGENVIGFAVAATSIMSLNLTNLKPSTTTVDLGTTANRWRDLYISNDIIMAYGSAIGTAAGGDHGIVFADNPYNIFYNSVSGHYFNLDSNAVGLTGDFVIGKDRTGSTGGTTYFTLLESTGNVGIGDASPGSRFVVQTGTDAGGSRIQLDTQTIKIVDRYSSNDYTAKIWASWPGYGILNFGVNDGAGSDVATPTISIRGTGRVGIGTTNPTSVLHVNGASLLGGTTTIGGNLVGAISGLFDLGTGSFKWRNLVLSGTATISGEVDLTAGLDWALGQTIKGRLGYGTGFVYVGSVTANGILKLVSGNGATACTFAANQDATFSGDYTNVENLYVNQESDFDGHVRPYADSSYTLGTSALRWSTIYGDTAILGNADGTGLLLGVAAFGGAANQRLQIGATLAGSSSATAQIAGLTRVGYLITHNTSEGIRPNANGQSTCGTSAQRWSNLYSQAGNFSGNVDITRTTTALLTIQGASSGYVNAGIVLKATSDTNYRGLGVYMHDAGGDTEWYAGTPYAASDQYIIARKASQASHSDAVAERVNALFTLKSDGNVGIGTTNPGFQLEVKETASWIAGININAPKALVKYSATDGSGVGYIGMASGYLTGAAAGMTIRTDGSPINFGANASNATHMTILTSGYVGINDTAPPRRLSVTGEDGAYSGQSSGNSRTHLLLENNAANYIEFLNPSNVNAGIFWSTNTAQNSAAILHDSSGALYFQTGGVANRLRIVADGSATFGGNLTINKTIADSAVIDYLFNIEGNRTLNAVAGQGVGIRFKIPSWKDSLLTYIGAGIGAVRESDTDSDVSTALTFSTSQNDATLDEAMRITSTGNVGIGTTSPGSYKLKVEGTTWLNDQAFIAGNNTAPPTSSNSQDFGAIRMSDGALRSMYQGCTATYGWIQVMSSTNHATNYPLALNPNGGSVGIGTITPDEKLEIYDGYLKITDAVPTMVFERQSDALKGYLTANVGYFQFSYNTKDGDGYIKMDVNSSGGSAITHEGNGYLRFGANNVSNQLVLAANGNVGIGTNAPNSKLEIAGFDSATSLGTTVDVLIEGGGAVNRLAQLGLGWTGHNAAVLPPVVLAAKTILASGHTYADFIIANRETTGGTVAPVEHMRVTYDGKVGIGTTNPGQLLEVGSSGDSEYALIGKTKVGGGMGHGDYAGFSHRSMGGTGNFALLQSAGGATYLNAASGSSIYFQNNNVTVLAMSGSGLTAGSNNVNTFGERCIFDLDYSAYNTHFKLTNASTYGLISFVENTTHKGFFGIGGSSQSHSATTSSYSASGFTWNLDGAGHMIIANRGTSKMIRLCTGAEGNANFDTVRIENGAIQLRGVTTVDTTLNIDGATVWNTNYPVLDYNLSFRPDPGYAGIRFNKAGGTTGSAGYLLIKDNSDALPTYSANGITLVGDTGHVNIVQRTSSTHRIRFCTGATPVERLSIANDGKVGIGTTAPARLLHVYGANDVARFQGAGSNYIDIDGSGTQLSCTTNLSFRAALSGNAMMTIKTDGNVGIGTVTPAATLDVRRISAAASEWTAAFCSDNQTLATARAHDSVLIQASDVPCLKIYEAASTPQVATLAVGDGNATLASSNTLRFYVNGSNTGDGYNGLGGTRALLLNSAGAATFVGSVTAVSFSGSGASLTTLNATNLSSGTVATARLGSGTASSSTFLRGDSTWATAGTGTVTGTGTDNYVPRWNGTTALQNSAIFSNDSGDVGIGNVAPGIYKLNVSGAVYAGGSVLIPNASYYFGALSSSGALISLMYLNSSNEAIFGSTSLATNGYPIRTLAKYITFEPAGTLGAAVETMRVTNSSLAGVGSVGIGTTAPERPLHVIGGIHLNNASVLSWDAADGSLRNTMYVDSGDDLIIGDTNFDDIYFSTGQKTKTVVIKQTTGNVGIGIAAPAAKLHVKITDTVSTASNVRVQAPIYPSIEFYSDNANSSNRNWKLSSVYSTYGTFQILASSTAGGAPVNATLAIRPDGNVGVGTPNPGAGTTGGPTDFGSDGIILEVAKGAYDAGITLGYKNTTVLGDIWVGAGTGHLNIDNRYDNADGDINFRTRTAGTTVNAVKIQGDGKVGIGTTAPASILHIKGGVGSFATGLTFGDGDTGFYEHSDDSLWYFSGGVKRWKSDSGYLFSTITASKATIVNEVATATNPVYTFYNDLDTGLGQVAANQLSLIAGGVKAAVVTSTGFGIRTTPASGVILDVRDSGDANTKQYLINTGQTTAGRETEFIFGKDNGTNLTGTLKYYYHTTQASRRIDLLHYGTNAGISILNNGSIGINDTAPDYMLTLKGGTVNGATRYPGIHGHHASNTLFTISQWFANEGYLALYLNSARTIVFRGGNTQSGAAHSYINTGASNNFGVGTDTPGAKLTVQGASTETAAPVGYFYTNAIHTGVDYNSIVSIRSDHASSTGQVLHVRGDGSGNLLTLNQGGTDRLVVQADGKVGIGTTNPSQSLDVYGNVTIDGGTLIIEDTGEQLQFTDSNVAIDRNSNDIVIHGYSGHIFTRNGAESMRINGNGSVGIGTNNPLNILTLHQAAGANIRFSNPTTGRYFIIGEGVGAPDKFSFRGNSYRSTDTLTVNFTTDRVGIGTMSPSEKLHVVGDIRVTGDIDLENTLRLNTDSATYYGVIDYTTFKMYSPPGSGNYLSLVTPNQSWGTGGGAIVFKPNNTEYMRVTPSGKVGIGTTNPGTWKLRVEGTGFFNGSVVIPNSGSYLGAYNSSGTPKSLIHMTSSNEVIINSAHGSAQPTKIKGKYITFETPDSVLGADIEVMRVFGGVGFMTAGCVGIGVTTPSSKLHVNGTITGTSKNFNIPHPDPSKVNARLIHASIEAPSNDTLYKFEVAISLDNETVTHPLPGYFKYLNKNPRMWIQARNMFSHAYGSCAEDLSSFSITGEKAGSYDVLIIATRRDEGVKDFVVEIDA